MEDLKILVELLGFLAILYGLYLTQRRLTATEEGQITERFTRAIEQLGHEDMEIRLGGIYALERLAKDSEKDHGPIMEVLTAYVRENAPFRGQAPLASLRRLGLLPAGARPPLYGCCRESYARVYKIQEIG